jgi:chromatin segregation and condensation protein Rec8/ScpA/Scc1 (kleisin family)
VAFLSVLELVRLSEISLIQRETFGEIMLRIASSDLSVDLSAEGA